MNVVHVFMTIIYVKLKLQDRRTDINSSTVKIAEHPSVLQEIGVGDMMEEAAIDVNLRETEFEVLYFSLCIRHDK